MEILSTIAIAGLTMLGIVVPAFFVFRAAIRKEKANEEAARLARLDANRKAEADEKAARIARLDAVDAVLWTRLEEALEQERAENARACAAIVERVTEVEAELEQEREARRTLASASQQERAQLLDRLAILEIDLQAALAEVAILRRENATLTERLRSQEQRRL